MGPRGTLRSLNRRLHNYVPAYEPVGASSPLSPTTLVRHGSRPLWVVHPVVDTRIDMCRDPSVFHTGRAKMVIEGAAGVAGVGLAGGILAELLHWWNLREDRCSSRITPAIRSIGSSPRA
jgi:hypothetical protein